MRGPARVGTVICKSTCNTQARQCGGPSAHARPQAFVLNLCVADDLIGHQHTRGRILSAHAESMSGGPCQGALPQAPLLV
jgi:hypothetical protein